MWSLISLIKLRHLFKLELYRSIHKDETFNVVSTCGYLLCEDDPYYIGTLLKFRKCNMCKNICTNVVGAKLSCLFRFSNSILVWVKPMLTCLLVNFSRTLKKRILLIPSYSIFRLYKNRIVAVSRKQNMKLCPWLWLHVMPLKLVFHSVFQITTLSLRK